MQTARESAVDGMNRAAQHADDVELDWTERAFRAFSRHAAKNAEFMTEDARIAAYQDGLPYPPDERAWGSVATRAVREGVVKRDRYGQTRQRPANAHPQPIWRSLIYKSPDAFADHVYFSARHTAKGWAVCYEDKPKHNAERKTTSYSLNFPVLQSTEYIDEAQAEKMVKRAASILAKHWDDKGYGE